MKVSVPIQAFIPPVPALPSTLWPSRSQQGFALLHRSHHHQAAAARADVRCALQCWVDLGATGLRHPSGLDGLGCALSSLDDI